MQQQLRVWIAAIALAFGVVACGGGDGGAPQPTGLLAGNPASLAAAAMVNMAPEPADDADIVDGLMLTRLDVGIAVGATVGQVNAALGSVGGSIVAMRAGLPAISVAVPRQSGEAALQALADTLRAQPGILLVLLPRAAVANVTPPAPPANTEAGPRSVRASTSWATISALPSWRTSPPCPVMQNTQPTAQPTWLDTHNPPRGSSTLSTL